MYIYIFVNNHEIHAEARSMKGIYMNDNKNCPITRTEAREYLFALLFAKTFAKEEDSAEFYSAEIENAERDFGLQTDYIHNVFFGIMDNLEEIDAQIEKNSQGWNLSRISKVSLSVMRLCVYEMSNVEDVPKRVAINEAIELTKRYDEDNAPAFVNGILNAIAHTLPERECDK